MGIKVSVAIPSCYPLLSTAVQHFLLLEVKMAVSG